MMDKHGGPAEYQRNLINAFSHSEEPEIIIVVHKLLTGFDAKIEQVGRLGEGHCSHATFRVATNLGRRGLGIVQQRELRGDEARGCCTAPPVDHPVVPCPGARDGELAVISR